MAEVNFGKTITLKQAVNLIVTNPETRFMLRGEPGIGKSSMLEAIASRLGYDSAYIDVPNMDLGDIAMPVIDHETRTTKYYPNARFKVHNGKPVVMMFDEFSKGADPVKNMLHPCLEKANPRLGDVSLDNRSVIFLTGNLTTDGVGDTLKAHTRNRIVELIVAKPSADEWIEWAIAKGIEPEVIAWVNRFPQVLASYTDGGQADNPYIYNPRKPMTAFVSPRSLETASNIVRTRKDNDADAVIAALTGAIGESGARDMQAYIEFADQLPTWEATISDPKNTRVPTSAGACAIVVFGAIARVTRETITPFMTYLERFEPEWQSVFAINISKTKGKQEIAFQCAAFTNWVAKNQDLL
jgi:ATPase family associated with various cellular activities (AAA)